MTATPSMQDERNRIEAELARMTARWKASVEMGLELDATIASLSEENRAMRAGFARIAGQPPELFPDPCTDSWRTYARAVRETLNDVQRIANSFLTEGT